MNADCRAAALLLSVAALGCATFPPDPQVDDTLAQRYEVRSSLDGAIDYLRRTMTNYGVDTREHRPHDRQIVISTEYLYPKTFGEQRRVIRVYYVVGVETVGDLPARRQLVTLSCQVETKGIFEKTWRRETSGRADAESSCDTPLVRELRRQLDAMVKESSRADGS